MSNENSQVPARASSARTPLRTASVQDRATWLLLALAAISFVAHMLVAGNYGYFRDELYYIADGHHLQAGYVDQPALMGWLAALMRLIANDNLVAIHVIPALASAAIVIVTGLLARELGGGMVAQLIAGVAALFNPDFLGAGSLFSMDVLDQLWWSLGSLFLARLIRRDDSRQWLLFGMIVAIGLLTKLTILFFGLAVVLALFATPERRWFRTKWPWLALAIALTGLLPYLIWNAMNGWQTVDFYRHYGYLHTGPIAFFGSQIGLMNPISFLLAIAGLAFYYRKSSARFRLLGWTFVFVYIILTIVRGKPYFLAPAYPILFSAGAVVLERAKGRPLFSWLRPAYIAAAAIAGLLIAPLAMPILPPATFARIYGTHASSAANAAIVQKTNQVFPQSLADRFGWERLTRTIQRVYAALPPDEQAGACILTGNYGEAGALSLLAAPGSLPPIISGHNNYWLWGPGNCSGRVLIVVARPGNAVQKASAIYSHVVLAATETCRYCVEYEKHLGIYVVSGPRAPGFDFKKIWPLLKHYD